MVSKKVWMEEYPFHWTEYLLPQALVMDSFNILPRDGKIASRKKHIWGIGPNWFLLAKKSVSTNKNKRFVVKINLH